MINYSCLIFTTESFLITYSQVARLIEIEYFRDRIRLH